MQASGSASGLREHALQQQGRIDALLSGDSAAGDALVLRVARDPELQKNLLIFRRLVVEAADLAERIGAAAGAAGRLYEAMTLAEAAPRSLKVLLARRFELENLLAELGDRSYLTARIAELYSEGPGTAVTWRGLYGDGVPALLDGPALDGADLAQARLRLIRLLRAKQAQDETARSRGELISGAVPRTTLVVAVWAVGLCVATGVVFDRADLLVLAAVAGGAGAALGGLLRLRDQIEWGTQARRFWAAFLGQLLVGVIAGVFALLLSASGAVRVGGGDAGVAVLALALGFSEAAFVRLLSRFATP